MNPWENDEPVGRLTLKINGVANETPTAPWERDPVATDPVAHGALDADPEKVARARAVAKATGLPPSVVEAEPDAAERELRRAQIEQTVARDPALARMMADPESARIAHDDVEQMGIAARTAGAFKRGVANLRQTGSVTVARSNAATLSNIIDIERRMTLGEYIPDHEDTLGVRFLSAEERAALRADLQAAIGASAANIAARQIDKEATVQALPSVQRAMQAKTFGEFFENFRQSPFEFVVSIGAESLPNMAPGIAAATVAAPLGLPAAAAAMGAGSFSVDYGASILKALAEEGVDLKNRVALEAATADQELMQRIGRKAFAHATVVGTLDAASGGAAALRMGRTALGNMGGQLAAQGALGGAGEAGGTIAAGDELHVGEIMAEVLGETVTAPIEVATMAASKAAETIGQQRSKAERAAEGAQLATKLLGDSAASKARARDPEAFRRYLTDATTDENGDVAEVFIDGEQFQQALKPEQLAELQEKAPEIAEQIAEAVEIGGDVRMPVADFVAAFAGTPTGEALAQHVRRGADEMSAAEAVVFASVEQESFRQEMARVAEKVTAEVEAAEDQRTVFGQILERLGRANRFSEDVNRINAAIPAAIIQTMAARQGLTAQEMAERWLPNVVAQSPANPNEVLRATDDPQFRAWFGNSKAVEQTGGTGSRDAKFSPQRMYHTTRNTFDAFEVGRTTVNSGTFGDWETTRSAIFVTPDVGASQAYGTVGGRYVEGANVMPLYVKAENPLDLVSGLTEQDAARLLAAGLDSRFIYNRLGHWDVFDGEEGEALVETLKAAGYDSVIFNDENPDTGESFETWALFSPEQIKSVFNRGTWDANDPNVLRATDEPQFRAWFGDSKAVDESGAPLVVYHGTNAQFDRFDASKLGESTDHPTSNLGFFFTSDPGTAEAFTTPTEDSQHLDGGPQIMPLHLSVQNPYEMSAAEFEDLVTSDGETGASIRELRDQLIAQGHDGIVVRADVESQMEELNTGDTWVAFRPEQIKSVFNRGTWDANDPNVLNQRAPRSDIGHKREKSTGRYVGAPDWVGGSPQKLAALRKNLRQLAEEGRAGRFWYEDSARAVLELVGNDKAEAEKFIALLAIYSQGTEVSANVTFALTAYYQWKAGLPIHTGRFPAAQSAKAEAILRRNEGWDGVKTNNFYNDLMEEIDPSKMDEEHATMDMWVALAFDYGSDKLDQGPKYNFAKREITRLAADMGVRPHQAQAMVWTAIKHRVESTAAKRTEIERKRGIQVRDEKGNWEVPKDKKYDHFRLAFKLAMEMPLDQAALDASKFDFGDALRDRMVQVSWEATPSTKPGRSLPGIHSATLDQKFEYLRAMRAALSDENGRDLIADLVGLPQGATHEGVSAWEGAVGAGAQTMLPVAPEGAGKTRAIREVPKQLLDLYAAVRGYVLEQDAVVYHMPVWDDAKVRHNGVHLSTARPLHPQEVQLLYSALSAKFGTEELAPAWRPDGARVLNFVDGLDNATFQKGFVEVVRSMPDDFGGGGLDIKSFRSEGDYIGNNWETQPHGEGYLERIQAGRPDLLGGLADLRARAEAVNRAFAERYGWDQPAAALGGEYAQSRGDGSAVRATTALGSSPAVGVHFSRQRRTVLDGRYYGTGIRGAESERVLAADDRRLTERVYVYLDEGAGVRPETGVGGFAHEVNLPTLYDARVDPLNIRHLRADPNAWESAILDGGYHGYFTTGPDQNIAVVIGPASRALQAKPVEPRLAVARGTASQRPVSRYSTALMSKEIAALDMEAIRAVAPSANLRMGNFTVDPSEFEAARAKAAEQGVVLPEQSLNQAVFHGTPHEFEAFSFDEIGSGEGAQAYGWGLYFADERGVAADYRKKLSSNTASYTVDGEEVWNSKTGKYGTPEHIVALALYDGDAKRVRDLISDYRRIGMGEKADAYEAKLQEWEGKSVKQIVTKGGRLLRADVPDEAVARMLLWDAPLSEQPYVQQALGLRIVDESTRFEPKFSVETNVDLGNGNHARWPIGDTFRSREAAEQAMQLLSGAEVYQRLERVSGDKETSRLMATAGIPGNRYLDGGSRGKGGGTYNTVVWDQAVLDEINASLAAEFEQRAEQPRGTYSPSTNTIALLEKANLSTFLHEVGHWGLELLVESAGKPGAPQQIVDDARTLLAFAGVESLQAWSAMSLEQRRAHHEKVAEAFETYLFEGRAPSAELQSAFSRIAAWMKSVYKALTGMRVQLTDEVRGVFDRMLATDEQIAEQSRIRDMAPMFESAEQAGVSVDKWRAYQALGEEVARDAVDELRSRSLRDMKWFTNAKGRALKKLQAQAKDARKGLRAEVEEEVDALPVYAALRFIQRGEAGDRNLTNAQRKALDTVAGGKTKLDLGVLKEMYGDSWPVLATRLQHLTAAEGGAHPEAVATAFGFDSADALVRAILAAEPRNELVEGLTDQRMLERHADLADPEALERAAEAAIHNEARIRFVATEYKALADAMNPREQVGTARVTTGKQKGQVRAVTVNGLVRAANQYAEAIVGRTVVRKLNVAVHARAAANESRAARAAMAAGDTAKAIAHKRNQLLHERTARAVEDARAEADKAIGYLKKFRNSNRARGSIDADYVEAIENLLVSIDTRSATNRRLDSLASLRKWMAAQEAAGLPVALDPELIESLQVQNVRDMTVEQLRGLVDQVKSIEHLGKLKKKLLTARDQREFEAITESLAESIREHGGKKRAASIIPEEGVASKVRGFFAEHRKLSSLARQMDGGVDAGPLWSALIRGMNDAGNRETSLIAHSTRALGEIFKPLLAMKGGLTGDKRLIASLGESFSRGSRIAVALNWGNEANRQRVLNTIPQAAVEEIFSMLTAAEWDAVQAVWDHINEYWPDIAAKEKRVTGVAPEKVEAAPFVVRVDGQEREMAGGYYPIVYDSEVSDVAAAHENAQIAKDMLAGAYGRQTTRRGHTKRRAEKVGEPLRFTLDVIERHISQVVHDLSWHEWLIDANRLLKDGKISSAIREHYGNEVLQSMREALRDIATGDLQHKSKVERAVAAARARVSAATMAWSVTTSLLQPFGLFQSIPRVGAKWILHGMKHWAGDIASFENAAANIREKSEMMRHRSTTMNRDIREITGRIHKGKSAAAEVFDASLFIAMQKMQLVADIPTWYGAYEKALAESPDEARAVALADQAVLDTQGGGQVKDLAGVQRGNELKRALSMFYSYFAATWNIASESTARTDFRKPAQVAGWLADMVMLSVVPTLAQQVIFGMLRGGGDDDDKDFADWLVDFAKELGGFWLSTLVGVREFSGMVQGYDYSGPAAARVIVEIGNIAKFAKDAVDPDEELDDNDYRRALKAVLTVLGLPATQIDRSWRGWKAWDEGEAGPGAVLMGPPPRER